MDLRGLDSKGFKEWLSTKIAHQSTLEILEGNKILTS